MLVKAQLHEKKIIKIQANVRGMLVRKHHPIKKTKNSSRKDKSKRNRNSDNLEAKMSHRSGEVIFKGGGMPERKGRDSYRNGLVYAKALSDMPDYSSFATRETEK